MKASKVKYPGISSVIHGNGAVAHVMSNVCGGVIGYPITPSTEIAEIYEAFRSEGGVNVWGKHPFFFEPEGEHSAQSGALGATLTGGQFISSEGDPDYPVSEGSLCAKGAAFHAMHVSKHRILKPLYRAPHATEWKEVEWEWAMEEIAKALPYGFGIAWNGISFQEQQAGSQTGALYTLSILIVFLCLAALYESWSIPFSVMLVVPLGVVGALLAASLRGMNNDVYFQVGLLTTIGLSAKNAILIVEFAKELYDQGKGLSESVIEAARLRLRPILMTSLAFILGVLPLATSSGAGASSRVAIGTGVIGGMVSATVLAIFFVPLFFVLIMRYFTKYRPRHERETLAAQEAHHD